MLKASELKASILLKQGVEQVRLMSDPPTWSKKVIKRKKRRK
jgi:hypothetical protein